jgi:hypothetical protein
MFCSGTFRSTFRTLQLNQLSSKSGSPQSYVYEIRIASLISYALIKFQDQLELLKMTGSTVRVKAEVI